MKQITIVFFNHNMFSATGETDKPSIVIDLTDEQIAKIKKAAGNTLDVLSIHPVINK
jgi:hypothetical protein